MCLSISPWCACVQLCICCIFCSIGFSNCHHWPTSVHTSNFINLILLLNFFVFFFRRRKKHKKTITALLKPKGRTDSIIKKLFPCLFSVWTSCTNWSIHFHRSYKTRFLPKTTRKTHSQWKKLCGQLIYNCWKRCWLGSRQMSAAFFWRRPTVLRIT